MAGRKFLIERYCSENWPQVLGRRPFIASGPRFLDWIDPASVGGYEYRLRRSIKALLTREFPVTSSEHRRRYLHSAACRLMLSEGVLCALWVANGPQSIPTELRWSESIVEMERTLAIDKGPVPYWTVPNAIEELISGMPSPAMTRAYVAEDSLVLEEAAP